MSALKFLILTIALLAAIGSALWMGSIPLAIFAGSALVTNCVVWVFFGTLGNKPPNENNRPTVDPTQIGSGG